LLFLPVTQLVKVSMFIQTSTFSQRSPIPSAAESSEFKSWYSFSQKQSYNAVHRKDALLKH